MRRIPPVVHFVFGLKAQTEPFHLLHYIAIESCRQVLQPETIYFHYLHLPYGVFWELARPHLTLVSVELSAEVLAADYRGGLVPEVYRYAHHADFVRLDALIEHGGVYADIDTVFLRPFSEALLAAPFVIGREGPVRDERSGELRPSLCNALMLAAPGSAFASTWRQRMGGELNGTWSNHSGFLAESLSRELPDEVLVEPERSFFPVPSGSAEDLKRLFSPGELDLSESFTLHLWSHLWWHEWRRDFSRVSGADFTIESIRARDTALNRLLRPYLPSLDLG